MGPRRDDHVGQRPAPRKPPNAAGASDPGRVLRLRRRRTDPTSPASSLESAPLSQGPHHYPPQRCVPQRRGGNCSARGPRPSSKGSTPSPCPRSTPRTPSPSPSNSEHLPRQRPPPHHRLPHPAPWAHLQNYTRAASSSTLCASTAPLGAAAEAEVQPLRRTPNHWHRRPQRHLHPPPRVAAPLPHTRWKLHHRCTLPLHRSQHAAPFSDCRLPLKLHGSAGSRSARSHISPSTGTGASRCAGPRTASRPSCSTPFARRSGSRPHPARP